MNEIQVGEKVYTPSKVVCVGRNYVEHIRELNNEIPSEPVIFIKPNSALSDSLITDREGSIHYEAELTFVVENDEMIAVGVGLDLTKRGVQSELKEKGLPWERAKAFDRSAVFSHFVPVENNFTHLALELWINGELVQHGNYAEMINKPLDILREVSTFMSFDGDLLMTGTPKGVGVLKVGDRFCGKVINAGHTVIEVEWTVTRLAVSV